MIRAIADREKYNVALIALHVLQILDEYRLGGSLVKFLQFGVLLPLFAEHIVDEILLYRAESHHAYALAAQFFVAQPADDLVHHCPRFRLVLLGLALIVKALGVHDGNF